MNGIASKSLEISFKCLFCCCFLNFFFTYRMYLLVLFLADICQAYQPLIDGGRKHDFVTVSRNCDHQLSGWYRFKEAAGTKMVTKCPPKYRCDADYPVWLDGGHPTVAEGKVSRRGCIHKHDCCDPVVFIQVKNCSSHYIYKLSNLRDCNARFCTTD